MTPTASATSLLAAALLVFASSGCSSRPAKMYEGPIPVQLRNASTLPLRHAMLMPVRSEDPRPWVEHIAAGAAVEMRVRPDRYDVWFATESGGLGGGANAVAIDRPLTIIVENAAGLGRQAPTADQAAGTLRIRLQPLR